MLQHDEHERCEQAGGRRGEGEEGAGAGADGEGGPDRAAREQAQGEHHPSYISVKVTAARLVRRGTPVTGSTS